MIDYDVMVFVRYTEEPDFDNTAIVLWYGNKAAIQIVPKSVYLGTRGMLIRGNRNIIQELQLIRPRSA